VSGFRPCADPGQLGGNAPRSAQFTLGQVGDPGSAATSLNQASERQNLLTAQQFGKPTSVLQQVRPSMNAESAQDYSRVLPGGYTLPSQNGQSASSWEASNYLRMQGQDSI
jgi:hypothetical protein